MILSHINRRIGEYHLDIQVVSVCPIDNENKRDRELIREFRSEFEFRSDIGNSTSKVIKWSDYCSDHLPNRDEEIDMEYHWKIEDQRLTAKRNQRRFTKYYAKEFCFYFYFRFLFPI
jgi:hypothetical protein